MRAPTAKSYLVLEGLVGGKGSLGGRGGVRADRLVALLRSQKMAKNGVGKSQRHSSLSLKYPPRGCLRSMYHMRLAQTSFDEPAVGVLPVNFKRCCCQHTSELNHHHPVRARMRFCRLTRVGAEHFRHGAHAMPSVTREAFVSRFVDSIVLLVQGLRFA